MTNELQLHHEVLTGLSNETSPELETIVTIHGLYGRSDYWGRFALEMQGKRQVIGLDLPGFGDSPRPDDYAYTPDDHIDAVVSTVESLGLTEPFTIAGHSYGGLVAAGVAARHPEHVKQLVTIGMPIHQTKEDGYVMAHEAARVPLYIATNPRGERVHKLIFETPIAEWFARYKEGLSPHVAKAVRGNTFGPSSRTLLGLIENPGRAVADVRYVLQAGVPVAAIYGHKDKWINQAGRDQLSALEDEGAQVFRIAGDHHLPDKHPERIAGIILNDLQSAA